jgi:hypothetical protein
VVRSRLYSDVLPVVTRDVRDDSVISVDSVALREGRVPAIAISFSELEFS